METKPDSPGSGKPAPATGAGGGSRSWRSVFSAKFVVGALVLAVLAVSGVFAWKHVRMGMYRDEIHALLAGRTDLQRFHVSSGYTSPDAYIAHGGGIGDFVYTNSVEAVCDSLDKGFRFIEIDLIVTTDGCLIGGHGWKNFKEFAGLQPTADAMSYDEVKDLKIKGKYTVLEGSRLAQIMREHPDWILVTDQCRDSGLILQALPFPDRMIVEIIGVGNYVKALRAGVKYPALSIKTASDLETAKECGIPIIVAHARNLLDKKTAPVVKALHDAGVTVLVADCDTPEFVKEHLGKSASKIYTNTWSPAHFPE